MDEVSCKYQSFEASFRETVTNRYLAEFSSNNELSPAA
jgi:hypothetical protein